MRVVLIRRYATGVEVIYAPSMITCLGDSITALPDAWPSLLDVPVDVRAVVGARVAEVTAQVEQAPGPLDTVIVSVGSNDVLWWGGEPVDAAEFARLADLLRARARRVAFLDVLLFAPWRPYAMLPRQRAVRAAIRATGLPVLRPWLPVWCWRRDRIHLNRRGQARLARAVADWLGS